MKKISLVLILFCIVNLSVLPAFARKKMIPEAKPITYKGIRFQPHFYTDAGVIEAFDVDTNKRVWEKKVFEVKVNPHEEWDNQWIVITALQITDDGQLQVADGKGRHYKITIPPNILKA